MINLLRMTAEYIEHEDRIALVGDGGADGVVRLWLIRPMTAKLVPALVDIIKPQHDDPGYADVIDTFKQAAAEHQHQPTPPVKYNAAQAGDVPAPSVKGSSGAKMSAAALPVKQDNEWLIREINVKLLNDGVALTFLAADDRTARCGFSEGLLRQWLGILRKVCLTADWVSPDWPEWMRESPADQPVGLQH